MCCLFYKIFCYQIFAVYYSIKSIPLSVLLTLCCLLFYQICTTICPITFDLLFYKSKRSLYGIYYTVLYHCIISQILLYIYSCMITIFSNHQPLNQSENLLDHCLTTTWSLTYLITDLISRLQTIWSRKHWLMIYLPAIGSTSQLNFLFRPVGLRLRDHDYLISAKHTAYWSMKYQTGILS